MNHAEHEEMLQQMFLEHWPTSDPRGATARACEACRVELARLAALEQRLRAAAGEQREVWSSAGRSADENDARTMRASLLATIAQRRRARHRRYAAFLVAAALLLAVWPALRWLGREAPAQEFLLGSEGHAGYSPAGVVPALESFTWPDDRPPGASFELRFHAVEDGRQGAPLAALPRIQDLAEARWTPTPEELSLLPRDFLWEVLVIDRDERVLARRAPIGVHRGP